MERLEDVLLERTEVNRYVLIYDGGWQIAACYIDDEDLFIKYMSEELLNMKVKDIQLVYDDDFTRMIYRVDV